jgi:hypothetical protein
LGLVFHGHFFRFRSCRFARYSLAGERRALRRIWRVAPQTWGGMIRTSRWQIENGKLSLSERSQSLLYLWPDGAWAFALFGFGLLAS